MAQQKKTNALAVVEGFQIANRYEGMTPEELEELQDQLEDLDPESGITCRKIKIPSGGGTSFEVQTGDDDDTDPMKTITGVVVFTHRLSGYWPNAYGTSINPQDKLPYCSSMDGKTGVCQETGEVISCETCCWNQFGTAVDQTGNQARGKACKNMRRLYIMMDGDPNLYLLTVPPTSIRDVNNQLAKIAPYANKVITLSLEKTQNAGGTAYSKVVIKKSGILPPAAAEFAKQLRHQIKGQYQTMAITMDDYAAAPERGKSVDVSAEDWPDDIPSAEFQEVPPPHTDEDLPFA